MASDNVRSEREQLFADKVPARLIAAGTGLIVGGPLGTLAAAAASPLLEYLLKHGNEKYVASTEAMLDQTVQAMGMEAEELTAILDTDDARLGLATNAMKAAFDTLDEQKVAALAQVLAWGLTDDAHIDTARLYVQAFSDLEPAHVRVLSKLVLRLACGRVSSWNGLTRDEAMNAFPGLAPALDNIGATLARHGLITATADEWVATTFGAMAYFWLAGGWQPESQNKVTRLVFSSVAQESLSQFCVDVLGVQFLDHSSNGYRSFRSGYTSEGLEVVLRPNMNYHGSRKPGNLFPDALPELAVINTRDADRMQMTIANGGFRLEERDENWARIPLHGTSA